MSPIKINDAYPWGRSFDEYRRMFALTDADLNGRIVGCADGPAAFNAAVHRLGGCIVSCDPLYALRAFADTDGLNFPLLSDFWPHGEVSRAYDVLDETRGAPRRSSYVIDREGTVRWSVHNAMPEGRDLDEHLRQLHAPD